MRVKTAAIILITMMLMAICCARAENVGQNKGDIYDKAVNYAQLELYDVARGYFNELGNFRDSRAWYYYCDAMVMLDEADEWERLGYRNEAETRVKAAKEDLSLLSAEKFPDKDALITYCDARGYQLKNMNYTAEDYFSQVLNVRDAMERFHNIRSGVALPTQAPVSVVPDLFPAVQAQTQRKVDSIYMGPGKEYKKVTGLTINSESNIVLRGHYNGSGSVKWYLLETETMDGKVRVWVTRGGYVTPAENKEIHEMLEKGKQAYTKTDTTALWGPGEEYAATGFTVPGNTRVLRFEQEGLYSMIEYTDASGDKMMVWVLTDSLT